MAVSFTADLHFGHNAITESCVRLFENIGDMNKAILKSWNARVTNKDHVYIVGDLYYGSRRAAGLNEAIETINKLNGILHLVAGNHDMPYLKIQNIVAYLPTSMICFISALTVKIHFYVIILSLNGVGFITVAGIFMVISIPTKVQHFYT